MAESPHETLPRPAAPVEAHPPPSPPGPPEVAPADPPVTYYGIPPLKHTDYKWPTAAAFFCNSVCGGAQVLAALADVAGGPPARTTVRAGRYLAAGGGILGTVLLISELHNKPRWYNMLRLFKKTSPMSIGIWSITPFVALSTLAALGQAAEDLGHTRMGRIVGRIFGIPAGILGTVVMTYMGTELEETNVPLWASAYPLLAPFYAAMGISNAAAALQVRAGSGRGQRPLTAALRRIAFFSGLVQTVLATLIARRWNVSPAAAFFQRSPYHGWFNFGFRRAGLMLPLLSNLLAERNGNGVAPRASLAGPLLQLGGGLLLQNLMIYAGRDSGDQPGDYFSYTRPETLPGPLAPAAHPPRTAGGSSVRQRARNRSWVGLALAAGAVIGGAFLIFHNPGGRR